MSIAQQFLVPAYMGPTDPGNTSTYWPQFYTNAPTVAYMVANYQAGPPLANDTGFTTGITNARAAGVKVLGYVHTSAAARSLAAIEADIDAWYSRYTIDGIFVDEVQPTVANLSYYTSLSAYIRAKSSTSNSVVFNKGFMPDTESYMGICDIFSLFEDTYANWLTTWNAATISSWVYKYPPNRFWASVYAIPDSASMLSVVDVAKSSGIGYIYVTDQVAPTNYTLPPSTSFWTAALAEAKSALSPIVSENATTGSSGWNFTNGSSSDGSIQAYLDKTSYNPGDTLTAFVSTLANGDLYNATIYRLGWYGGFGGRQMHQDTAQTGVAQGYFDGTVLQSCPTAIIDSTTHRIEAGWASSYTFTLPNTYRSGLYMLLFTNTTRNKNWACLFVVKGSNTADYVAVIGTNNDQAYNPWGGYSLYSFNSTASTPATKVSFNRPDYNNGGTGIAIMSFAVQWIHWMEQLGYDVAYRTSTDLHENAAELLNHKAYISPGHDEYWSKAMRDGVEAAIAAGKSALFGGANCCYWQVRFETDNAGTADRTLVGYKVITGSSPAPSTDPMFGVNNAIVTCNWRDVIVNRPEASMIGVQYDFSTSDTTGASNVGFTVANGAPTTYLAGTGMVAGNTYGTNIIGYEIDKQDTGSPGNLQILGSSPISANAQNTAYYKAPAGGLVFATGAICWGWALSGYQWSHTMTTRTPVSGIQILTQNILGALKGPVWRGLF